MSAALAFRSADGRFGLAVPALQVRVLLRLARKAHHVETGGILVGSYSATLDCAHVTGVSAAPKDSKASGWSFERGVRGLERWLIKLWNAPQRSYYLGEWHFHPHASPEASLCDRTQMVAISHNASYRCPEPLLLVLGGDPNHIWDARAYAFHAGAVSLALERGRTRAPPR
jgi:integrative and conjugative element protein (TIGR02256 family)